MNEQEKYEKVIKGLQCCQECDGYTCRNCCPYYDRNEPESQPTCTCRLAHDAFALLKAQEPRVMSIGDLYGYDMGFYERRDEEIVWPVLISRGGPDDDETVGFVRKDGYELRSDCGLMNITWRIWTAYPPHKLREVTPWQ